MDSMKFEALEQWNDGIVEYWEQQSKTGDESLSVKVIVSRPAGPGFQWCMSHGELMDSRREMVK